MKYCKRFRYCQDILLILYNGRIFRKNRITQKWNELKTYQNHKGYLSVSIYVRKGKRMLVKVHRLVALAFIPNPDNLPQVNHKDENKQNNCVSNLEWCDCRYNIRYSLRKHNNKRRKNYKIVQFDILGNKIAEYNSVNEAQLVNDLPHLNKKLNQHFKGEYKTLYGYIWKKILL